MVQQTSVPVNTLYIIQVIAAILSSLAALANLGLAYYLFIVKDKKENIDKARDLRRHWFKTLILDYNLELYFDFFDKLEEELKKLRDEAVNETDKKQIEENIRDFQKFIRVKFIDILLAVDDGLYQGILSKIDDLIDGIVENVIFNEGIKLKHPPKFLEVVSTPISQARTETIKMLFNYKGDEPAQLNLPVKHHTD